MTFKTHAAHLLAGFGALFLGACAATDSITTGAMGDAFANAVGIPQIDAFLPYAAQVPPTESLPIDGDWTVSTLGKTIRIEGGRAYAIDPWTHAMTLKVRPNMVVMRDIKQISDTHYTAYNLPIPGETALIRQPDGTIAATVNGIPRYQFVLIPEATHATGITAPPVRAAPPAPPYQPSQPRVAPSPPDAGQMDPDTCTLALDPASGTYVCVAE